MRRDRGSLDRHGDGKPFSGENLADDFGSQSAVTREGIGALYRALVGDDSPEVPAALNRWKRLVSGACGHEVGRPSPAADALAARYGIPLNGLRPAEMLFAVHTYYALLVKLLVWQVAAPLDKLSMPAEDDPFSWYTAARDEPIERTLYYRFLFEYAKRRRPAVMIETGTFRGHSAAHLAAGNPEGRVVTIDHDPEAAARVRAMNLANVTPVTGDSLAVFHNVRDLVPEVDLLFLDSSMKFPHAHEEREAYSTLVRPGCPILLDDIFINPDMEKTWSLVPPEKAEANGLHYKGFGISVKSVAPGEP